MKTVEECIKSRPAFLGWHTGPAGKAAIDDWIRCIQADARREKADNAEQPTARDVAVATIEEVARRYRAHHEASDGAAEILATPVDEILKRLGATDDGRDTEK